MEVHNQFIQRLAMQAEADHRIRAAWLEGSFGKGIADRYADVDAHLLINAAKLDDFRQHVRAWLEKIRPLVLFRTMFNGQMVNALTVDGLRMDIWMQTEEPVVLAVGESRVLYAEEGAIRWEPAPDKTLSQEEAVRQLDQIVPEFWRCIAMLPVVLGRRELIVSAVGAFIELQLLTDVLTLETGLRKDRGAKARNDFLPAPLRRALEEAIFLPKLTPDALARFHLRLATLMQTYGPSICAKWGTEYPQTLEDAVLRYVSRELNLLDLETVLV